MNVLQTVGQLLEKALATKLLGRRAELISSPLIGASVIVVTSRPSPEASGEDSRRFFAKPAGARSPNSNPSFFAPEDHDLPLRTILQDIHSSCVHVDLQPHGGPAVVVHEVVSHVPGSLINSSLAVPWSPV